MEKINTESIISSLFVLGFDKVDSILYTYILGKLIIDNQTLELFKFEDKPLSNLFIKYVEIDNTGFKIKEEYKLKTNISPIKEYNWTLRDLFSKNIKLISYLNNLDYNEIINQISKTNKIESKEKRWNPNLWKPLGIKPIEFHEYNKPGESTGGFLPYQNPEDRYIVRGIMPDPNNKTLELKKYKK